MKRTKLLMSRRKAPKVSVSTALQKPVKVSFCLALTEPDSSSSDYEPTIRKKKRLNRHVKVPVNTSSAVILSSTERENISRTPHPPLVEGPSVSNPVPPGTSERQRRVCFGNVEVFRFAFAQGHDTVPAKGGVSLGMENTHHARHLFQLGEYGKYCKAEKRTKLLRLHAAARHVAEQHTRNSFKRRAKFGAKSSSLKRSKYADKAIEMSMSSSETEEQSDGEGKDHETLEQCHVYEPEPMRRALLANSGVAIEESIADESLRVVETRAQCGCRCEGQQCVPELCECALNGIQCQVDSLDETNPSNSFPCSCSASSCSNPEGRVELDLQRIKNHFSQTLMRLKAAKKKGMDETGEMSSPQHIFFKEEEEEKNSNPEEDKEKPNTVRTNRSPQRRNGARSRKKGGGTSKALTEKQRKGWTKAKT